MIKQRIADLMAGDPKLTFRTAWYKLQAENPDWLKSDDPGWDPDTEEEPGRSWHEKAPSTTGDEYGEVSQPHVSYRTASASLVVCECASDVFVGEAPSEIVYTPPGRQQIKPLVSDNRSKNHRLV